MASAFTNGQAENYIASMADMKRLQDQLAAKDAEIAALKNELQYVKDESAKRGEELIYLSDKINQTRQSKDAEIERLQKEVIFATETITKLQSDKNPSDIEKRLQDALGEIEYLKRPLFEPGAMSDAYQRAHIRIADETIRQQKGEITALTAKVDRYEKALKVYANPKNWRAHAHCVEIDTFKVEEFANGYDIAAEAIEKIKEEGRVL